ncbi:MAG TPA: hypothetical protein PK313_08595 [Myxococcota bacterium]|jgi:hypothetical protein|nr:hypothetical protein [Myxococcota bacterium]
MPGRHLFWMLLVTSFLACAGTETVRRTALVPAPYLPSRIGEPLDDMEVRVQGEANPVRLSDGNDPIAMRIHDTTYFGMTGMLIPQAHIGASLYFAPIRHLEIGGQFRWASYRWARANKAGVLGFPAERQRDLWQGGLGLRGNIPIRRIDLTISPILQMDFVQVPEAEFVRPSEMYPEQGYPAGFAFSRVYRSTWAYPSFFLQVDKGFLASTLHVHMMIGIQRTLENIGSDDALTGSTSVSSAAAMSFGIGVEYRYRWFVVGATFFYPVAVGERIEAVTFGPSLAMRLGATLGGRRKASPSREGPREPGVETAPPGRETAGEDAP